jgi:diacylglycerol kinase (ATP)
MTVPPEDRFVVVVNPAAGGGRAGRRAPEVLARLRSQGRVASVYETRAPGEATGATREAYRAGTRRFLAVGGDGTTFEMLNGLFPEAAEAREPPLLASLPLGTGNSFLRDFGVTDAVAALAAVEAGRERTVDVVRCVHREGELFYVNLLSTGFSATAGELTNRAFKPLGPAGYVAAVLACVARLAHPVLPIRLDDGERDDRPAVLLSFSNSRYTAGTMEMAPRADPSDGELDVVRIGALSRLRFVAAFPRIFQGTHVRIDGCEQTRARRVEIFGTGPIPVMVDGEVLVLEPTALEVLPGSLRVMA